MSFAAMKAARQVRGLPHSAKLLLVIIADYADKHGQNAFPSIKTLAGDMECNPRSVQRLIKILVDHEIIAVKQRAGHNVYDLLIPVPPVEGDDNPVAGHDKIVVQETTILSPNPITYPINDPSSPPAALAVANAPADPEPAPTQTKLPGIPEAPVKPKREKRTSDLTPEQVATLGKIMGVLAQVHRDEYGHRELLARGANSKAAKEIVMQGWTAEDVERCIAWKLDTDRAGFWRENTIHLRHVIGWLGPWSKTHQSRPKPVPVYLEGGKTLDEVFAENAKRRADWRP